MKALVTGAAGYVGSTVVSALLDAGDQPIGLDDLSRGRRRFLDRIPHYIGDIGDPWLLDRLFTDHPDIDIAIHCAAHTSVGESVADPLTYYRENVAKAVQLFHNLTGRGCLRLIFSSSAAVYGRPATQLVSETAPVDPASPYAATKLMVERILDDLCAATPMNALSLRYFNPVGADPRLRSGPNDGAPDVLGQLIAASSAGTPFWIHGDDWETRDGTALRDFVHVWDVARAHVAAAHRWSAIAVGSRHEIVNIGSGRATTIRELADTFNRYAPQPVAIRVDGRRAGDTVGCYASTAKAARLLDWQHHHSLDRAIQDALRWADRAHLASWDSNDPQPDALTADDER
jgi:UDP-glucose 4-epimerase